MGFCPAILEYCSAVFCSAVNTHLKPLDRAESGAWFLTGGVLECDIAHHWSVAVLSVLYKIRCNPMHSLNGAVPGPYVPVHITRGALVRQWYTYVLPLCRTSQYHRTFIPFSVSPWTILLTRIRWCGIGRFHEQGQCFLICLSCSIPTIVFYYFSLSLLSVYRLVLWGWGLQTDRVYITLPQPCSANLF